jgi:hypothetical protein
MEFQGYKLCQFPIGIKPRNIVIADEKSRIQTDFVRN